MIELNGASAEATHIYDPAVTLLDTYVMSRQWRIAFETGLLIARERPPADAPA